MCFSENSAASNDPVQTGECARDEKLDGLIAYKLFLHGFTQITTMMYADETMVTPNKFLFPENSNRAGIHRESQPAQPYRAVRQERSFTRRTAMQLDLVAAFSASRSKMTSTFLSAISATSNESCQRQDEWAREIFHPG